MLLRLSHTFRTFNSYSSNVQYWNARGPVTTITWNRPEWHNAFDREVSAKLNAPVKEISVDRGCRIVILRGAGDTCCAPVMREGVQQLFALNPEPRLKPRIVLTVRQYGWAGLAGQTVEFSTVSKGLGISAPETYFQSSAD